MADERQEIFRARIDIQATDFEQLKAQLNKIRDYTLGIVKEIQVAFDSLKFDIGGLGASGRFGETLKGLSKVGPRGGVSELDAMQVGALAEAIRRLGEETNQTLPEIVANFSDLSKSIAEASGISLASVESNIGGGLRQIAAIAQDSTVEIEHTWRRLYEALNQMGVFGPVRDQAVDLSRDLVGESIIPEMVHEIQRYLQTIPATAGAPMEQMRTMLIQTFQEARDKGGSSIADLNLIWNRNLIQMWKTGQITGTQFRYLASTVNQVGQSFSVSADKIRRAAVAMEAQQAATVRFNQLMGSALKQTHGLREGISLMTGGEGLLGLRTALFGTTKQVGVFGTAIDSVRSIMARFTDDTTKEERALIKSLEAFQQRSIAVRTGLEELKRVASASGVSASTTNQLTFALNSQVRAVMRQVQAGQASRQVTAAGIAEMRNSIAVMQQHINNYRRLVESMETADEGLLALIDSMEQYVQQQEGEIDIVEARNKIAEKSRKQRQEESKELEEQTGIFKRLISSLNIFKRGQDEVTSSGNRLTAALGGTRDSLFRLVGAFTAADLAADAIRATFRRVGEGVRIIKDEILGFGVIQGFLDTMFTGVVEFSAGLEQMRITLEVIGKQAGLSSDFIAKRLYDLREANIATQAASELMIRSFALGPEFIGRLEGAAAGVDLLREAIDRAAKESEVMADLSLEFGDALGELRQGLVDGTQSGEDMVLTIFRMAQSISDPIEQMRFLKMAMDEGVLGQEALAKAAQNTAAALGKDTGEALEAFANAVQRATTEAAESYGIVTNASQFFEQFGEVIEADAESLQTFERQQAVMLGIVQETLPFMEVYGEVSETAGKKISSMRRVIESVKETIGDLFLPVLNSMLDTFRDFAERFAEVARSEQARKLAAQFGELVQVLNPINIVLRVLVENFQALAPVIGGVIQMITALFQQDWGSFRDAALDALTGLAIFFEDKIAGAVEWGWNLIVNFTNGIIDAANSVLTSAINTIGSIMASFLAPGSPPKKGPLSKIREWGSGLMSELAEGMSSGATGVFTGAATATAKGLISSFSDTFRRLDLSSFKVIRDAIGQIRGIFTAMVSAGRMEETEVVPGLVNARELLAQLADQWEETGEISENILNKIGDRLGEAGEDVKKYIRLQFQLQQAKKDLEQIDKEIALAERAGVVPAELRKRRDEAAGRIDAISEQLELQKELLAWQQESNDLVKQQIDLLKRIADEMTRSAAAGARGQQDQWEAFLQTHNAELAALEEKKRLGVISEEEYLRARLSLEQRYIDTAIKLGKPLSDERIAAFKALQARVAALTGKGKGGLETASERARDLREELTGLANEAAAGFKATEVEVQGTNERFAEMRKKIEQTFSGLGERITRAITDKLKEIGDWLRSLLPIDLEVAAERIRTILTDAFKFVRDNAVLLLGGALAAVFAGPAIGTGITGAFGALKGALAPLLTILGPLTRALGALAKILLGPLLAGFKVIIGALVGVLGPVGAAIVVIGALVAVFVLFREEIGQFIEIIGKRLEPVFNIVEAVISRLYGMIKTIVFNITTAIKNFIARLLEMDSIRRMGEKIIAVLKILAVVVGVTLAAALNGLAIFITALSYALDPFLRLLADTIDLFLSLANIIIDTVLAPFKILWTLLTEGPEEALQAAKDFAKDFVDQFLGIFDAIGRIAGDIVSVIVDPFVGWIDSWYGMITGRFGEVVDFLRELPAKIGEVIDDLLDHLGILGDAIQGIADAAGGALDWLGRKVGLIKDESKDLSEDLRDELSDTNRELKRWQNETEVVVNEGLRAFSQENIVQPIANFLSGAATAAAEGLKEVNQVLRRGLDAKALADSMREASPEVRRLLQEQVDAQAQYSAARQEVFARHAAERATLERQSNDEIVADLGVTKEEALEALRQKHTDEIIEIETRYKEEARLRKEAIAEALVDLAYQVAQEKLARVESGAAAAEIVAQLQRNAQAIEQAYGVETNAAQRMADESAGALFTAAFWSDEFTKSVGLSTETAIGLFGRLQAEGYDSLTAKSQETVTELILNLAQFQIDAGASFQDIANSMALLPSAYQEQILPMLLDEKSTTEEILAALEGLDRTVEPRVKIRMDPAGKVEREAFEMMSPKFQMQEALENLVEFAKENVVSIVIELIPEEFQEFIGSIIETGEEMARSFRDIGRDMSDTFIKISARVGQMRTNVRYQMDKMMDEALEQFRRFREAPGIISGIIGGIGGAIEEMRITMLQELKRIFGDRYTEETIIYHMYWWGVEMIRQLSLGIYYGIERYLIPALEYLDEIIGGIGGVTGGDGTGGNGRVIGEASLSALSRALETVLSGSVAQMRAVGAAGAIITDNSRHQTIYTDTLIFQFPDVTGREGADEIFKVIEERTAIGSAYGLSVRAGT